MAELLGTDKMKGIQPTRVHELNDADPAEDAKYVLYWMQASQRTRCNHALEYAIEQANHLEKPLVVCFGLMDDYPEANERHYVFMLEGLRDVEANLKKRDIKFVCKHGQPAEVALHYAEDAVLLVGDMSYTREPRKWYDRVADDAKVRYVQVESEVVVPVEEVSDKQEHAARTIRPKIHKKWDDYFVELPERKVGKSSVRLKVTGDIDVSHPTKAAEKLKIDRDVKKSPCYTGGEDEAQKLFCSFIDEKLKGYSDGRNEPSDDFHSYMSMYLHFGQVSPVELAMEIKSTRKGSKDDRESYLEEMIVRRELSKNFVWYCRDYDSYSSVVPDWAKKTLKEHKSDERPHRYTRDELEKAETDDDYWNAAQKQMTLTGFMHNYMRMYWGKKILEWCNTPQYAYETTLYLNNKYFIDGRDPNSFGNVGWIYGLHDRGWTERDVFGKVRYMAASGLERKFDIEQYVEQIQKLEDELKHD